MIEGVSKTAGEVESIKQKLAEIFNDVSLFGFSPISRELMEKTGCKTAVVTLMPYNDLTYMYSAAEFFDMTEELRKIHSVKLNALKEFLGDKNILYSTPPASPMDDGEYFAEFSYKWAAIAAGLGFIGKNDVFVHYKYAQRVRISCLLIDVQPPVFSEITKSECSSCNACVDACPYNYITGKTWRKDIHRNELINYKLCATKSRHSGEGQKYLCARCSLACKFPELA